ncbi:MAG: EpsG family protein [Oscillospiraceae bacterium]
MIVYYIALGISVTLAIILEKKKTVYVHQKQFVITQSPSYMKTILMLLPLFMVLAFRWNVGVDSFYGGSYSRAYHLAATGISERAMEPGYFLLSMLFSMLHVPFFWFLFFLASVYILCVSYAIFKLSVSPAYSIFLFVILMSYFDAFSALRQATAQGICMAALARWLSQEENQKNDVIYLVTVGFAAMFHYIALIYIFLYLVSRRKYSKKNYIVIILCLTAASPLIGAVLNLISSFVSGGGYQERGWASSYAIIALFVLTLCVYKYDTIISINPRARVLINLSLCTFVFMINSSALLLPYRFFDVFKIGYIFTIPYVIKSEKTHLNRVAMTIAIVLGFGLFFWNAFYNQDTILRQYQSALSSWEYVSTLY